MGGGPPAGVRPQLQPGESGDHVQLLQYALEARSRQRPIHEKAVRCRCRREGAVGLRRQSASRCRMTRATTTVVPEVLQGTRRRRPSPPMSEPGKDAEFRQMVGGALSALVVDTLPSPKDVVEVVKSDLVEKTPALIVRNYVLSRKGKGEAIKAQGMCSKTFAGHVVVWVHPDGIASLRGQDGALVPAAQKIIDADAAILKPSMRSRPDGSGKMAVDKGFAGLHLRLQPLGAISANRVPRHPERDRDGARPFVDDEAVAGRLRRAGPWTLLASRPVHGPDREDGRRSQSLQVRVTSPSLDDPMMLYPGSDAALRRHAEASPGCRSAIPLLVHERRGDGMREPRAGSPGNGQVRRRERGLCRRRRWSTGCSK